MRFYETGAMVEFAASGATRYTRAQTAEVFALLDEARKEGRGSAQLVLRWLAESPRALHPLLATALSGLGYEAGCMLCERGADGRRYSVASARRLFGVSVHHQQLVEHRRHAKVRRPYHPEMGRPPSTRAPWERASRSSLET
jgi:hypothetical protein